MARFALQLLPLILYVLYISGKGESATSTNFVQAKTALARSSATAGSVKANMSKLKKLNDLKATEYRILKDCLGHIKDSADLLSRSVREFENLGRVEGDKFLFHQSNVQTWTSAALTEITTCDEEFSSKAADQKFKGSVQGQVANLKKLLSNVLALVQGLAVKN